MKCSLLLASRGSGFRCNYPVAARDGYTEMLQVGNPWPTGLRLKPGGVTTSRASPREGLSLNLNPSGCWLLPSHTSRSQSKMSSESMPNWNRNSATSRLEVCRNGKQWSSESCNAYLINMESPPSRPGTPTSKCKDGSSINRE